MRVIDAHSIEEIAHVWIPLPDGTKLAARIWRPLGARSAPVPALLEYIPYRKGDLTAPRDSVMHAYFAAHGYASVRVDLRGSGDSEGILTDEYLERELLDGVDVIEWIAAQPWCNGQLGMMGISWGGFNALQIAAKAPPALGAILTACSTDDRYSDDVHYMGGCLLGDNLSWSSTMLAYGTLPPDPMTVGDSWRAQWMARLNDATPWVSTWLAHQRRDAYWRHGSVCEDYARIRVPVFAVGGWADGYSNAIFRMLQHLTVPRLGLIGPWGHKYPHLGVPGPAIGFLQEALRWWDHWLKGHDTGIMDEPLLRAWMQDSVAPSTSYATRPGRWVSEEQWPTAAISDRTFRLAPHRLIDEEGQGAPAPSRGEPSGLLSLRSPFTLGEFAGKWCSFSALPQLPHDQRQEDGGALVFDSEPLDAVTEIFGAPVVELDLRSDEPIAMVAARLSDVRPDGGVTRVTYGLLNITHRDGHAEPKRLEPGRRYRVELRMNEIAQVFPRGHRIRLALSTSLWPLAWLPPRPVTLSIAPAGCRLRLPQRSPRPGDGGKRSLGEPEGAAPEPIQILVPPRYAWHVIRDLAADRSTLEVSRDDGTQLMERTALRITRSSVERYSLVAPELSSARGEVAWDFALSRGTFDVRIKTRTVLTSNPTHFHVAGEVDAYEGGERCFCTSISEDIERDGL